MDEVRRQISEEEKGLQAEAAAEASAAEPRLIVEE